jgi:hypothetical protein
MKGPEELFDITKFLIQTTGADGVIVLVLAGPEGPYYSAQVSTSTSTLALQRSVDCLREIANEISKGIEGRQAS